MSSSSINDNASNFTNSWEWISGNKHRTDNLAKYGDGKFDFIQDLNTRELYQNAHWAITETKLWGWLSKYTVDKSNGFMFASSLEIEKINDKMREQPEIADSHSGTSYGITMRAMHYIAVNGYDNFVAAYNKNK